MEYFADLSLAEQDALNRSRAQRGLAPLLPFERVQASADTLNQSRRERGLPPFEPLQQTQIRRCQ
jgi:phosphopantetheine adenylyltransferase